MGGVDFMARWGPPPERRKRPAAANQGGRFRNTRASSNAGETNRSPDRPQPRRTARRPTPSEIKAGNRFLAPRRP
jgi:hypothetical protein